MADPYQGQARAPAAVQPGLRKPASHSRPSAYVTYSHADVSEGIEPGQARQYAPFQQGTAAGPPVLQGHPPVLQGYTARTQDVRVQCEAPDCQALLQVHEWSHDGRSNV